MLCVVRTPSPRASFGILVFVSERRSVNRNEMQFRVLVCTRFDADIVDPHEDALVFVEDHGLPPFDLQLYNNTGKGHSGYHYEPLFLHKHKNRRNLPHSM